MHDEPFQYSRRLIGVTGAQGVGKTTFCERLAAELATHTDVPIHLMAGLGARMAELGVSLGSNSTPMTIPAVYAAHLERELSANNGIVILDRCVVDALAYTRCLGLVSPTELRLYTAITELSVRTLSLIIPLQLSPFFLSKGGCHETRELRERVSREIPEILVSVARPTIALDASEPTAIADAVEAILKA